MCNHVTMNLVDYNRRLGALVKAHGLTLDNFQQYGNPAEAAVLDYYKRKEFHKYFQELEEANRVHGLNVSREELFKEFLLATPAEWLGKAWSKIYYDLSLIDFDTDYNPSFARFHAWHEK